MMPTHTAGHRRWVVLLGTIVAIGPMSIDMYLPSLPALQADLGADTAAVQRTLSAYFLGLAAGQLLYGPLADRFGRRVPLLAGLMLYLLASALCALAPTIEWLSAARLLQAAGGCAGIVITRAMIRDRFGPQEMARILSALLLVMGLAPIFAPLAGGQLLALGGWRAIFIALTLFGLLCVLAAWRGLPETQAHRGPPLRLGATLAAYARLLADRRFMGYALAGGCASAGLFAYISGAAFVFIEVYGIAPERFGLWFGANAVGLIAASQLNGLLLRRYRAERILRGALAAFAALGGVLAGSALLGWGGMWGLAVPLFFCIATLGFSFPNASAVAMAPFAEQAGLASALIGTLQYTLAAGSGAAVGLLHDGTPLPMAGVVALCGLGATAALWTLAGRSPAPSSA